MKTKTILCLGAAIMPFLAGCASTPVALSPVGPEPTSRAAAVPRGGLRVFSDTEAHVIGDGPAYYTHTGYSILDEFGKVVKYVPNHIGDMDESPSMVAVPAGDYKIVAESSSYGRVTVPVLIEEGKTTSIHLDREWRPSANVASNELVYLPDGEAIGWSTSPAKSSE
jgi:hypothetical protein